jgi:hypothetical protein
MRCAMTPKWIDGALNAFAAGATGHDDVVLSNERARVRH